MVSQQIVDIIIKAQDQASATANKVDESIKKIGDSSSRLSRIPGFDALKGKFSSIASTIDSKFGGAFTKARNHLSNFKNSITGAASTLKGKLGSAVDGVRNKLSNLANGAKGVVSAMNFLKGAASMAVGMIGYDLVNALIENTRASLNARSSLQAFAGRLGMSASEVDTFQQSLDNLQNTYKKIDMDVVGQQATDMAYRLGLPKTSLAELTETTAIFTDAMQRNGRSAEDSMLAMSDAMDGQFTRLKEIGISQEDLMRNGWSGDLEDKEGLLKAMNAALKEQNYDELAKSVDTLDDAWQVLSITLGNLLEAILLPLTPAIVAIIDGFTNAINALKPFIQMLQGAWGALPDWIKDTAWAGALVIAIILIGNAIWVNLIPALAAAAVAAIDFAAAMLANPLTWVVVALVAVALAIYEVGKAFGWWTDVQSMLAAIWAGLNRLWSAFVNHPDVQAAISAISGALQWLWSAVQQAGQAVMDFFGINEAGNFDIVRTLIDGIGMAWEVVTEHIRTVISIVQGIIGAFETVAEYISGFGEFLGEVWTTIMSILAPYIGQIVGLVMGLIGVFNLFKSGQIDLPTAIATVLGMLWNSYTTILSMISSAVLRFAGQMLSYAVRAATNFVNGIVTRISQLPGRVGNLLRAVVAAISGAISGWISAAVRGVQSLVSQVVSRFTSLPNNISSALGGVVSAITSPFKQAYDAVVGLVDDIKSKVQEGLNEAAKLVGAAGGDMPMGGDLAAGGDLVLPSNDVIVSYDNSPIEVEHTLDINLSIDAPGHISTDDVVRVLTDRNVIRELVNNRDFQLLDGRAKERLNLKVNRSRGV